MIYSCCPAAPECFSPVPFAPQDHSSPGGRGDHGSRDTSHLCLFLPPAQADTSGGRKSHQLFLLLTSTARGEHDGGPGSNKLQRSCRIPGSWARLGIASAQSCFPTGEAEPGPRGSQHPALGTPPPTRLEIWSECPGGCQDFTWQPTQPPHSTQHSTAKHGVSPAHLEPRCVLHPSGQQLPGWAGAPQLQSFKALSPQLQVMMLVPTLMPIPTGPSPAAPALPLFTRGSAKALSPCRATDRERRGFV